MKEKVMSVISTLTLKLVALKTWLVGLKRFLTLKTASWVIPAVIIVVGTVVLFSVPVQKVDETQIDTDELVAGDSTMQVSPLVGMYESGVLPAASTPGREFTLALAGDGSATFVADYKNGDRLVDEIGEWTVEGSILTLTVTRRFGNELQEPVAYTFAVEDDALRLVEYDLSRWGYMGLLLVRK